MSVRTPGDTQGHRTGSNSFQELIELLTIGPTKRRRLPAAHFVGLLQDKLQTDPVVAQAYGSRQNGDRAQVWRFQAIRYCERHLNQCAWGPTLLALYIQPGRADIPDSVRHRRAASPEVCCKTRRRLPWSFPRVRRPPTLQPVLGWPGVLRHSFVQADIMNL